MKDPMELRLWRFVAALLLAAVLCAGNASPAATGKHFAACCAQCGCQCTCCKVCRLECTEKGTPVAIWGLKCEDFCIPCPSTPKCDHCISLHDGEAKEPPCACPKKFVWTAWLANCHAKTFTRKKLMKQIASVKTPSYKWVVEDLCPECHAAYKPVRYPAGTNLPPQPDAAGAIVIAGFEESSR